MRYFSNRRHYCSIIRGECHLVARIFKRDYNLLLPIGAWRSPASALAWGARGRRFKSSRPDSLEKLPQKRQNICQAVVFLMSQNRTTLLWSLTSVALHDAYTDFMLSRQAKNATKATLDFYQFMLGKFLQWAESQGICAPGEITGRHVRQFIAGLFYSSSFTVNVFRCSIGLPSCTR